MHFSCDLYEEDYIDTQELNIQVTQFSEFSKATKLINVLALQELMKNKNFADNYYNSPQVEVRSSCPDISPDPKDYDPNVLTEYTIIFDRCAISDQLIGVAGTPIIIGELRIKLQGELGNPGCEFNISGEDISIGAVKYIEVDITQIHDRAITSDTCVKRDIIDFKTSINALKFTVDGIETITEQNNTLEVLSATNARTRYRDYSCNTDLNDFISIIDDRIVIQADTLISVREDINQEKIINNIYTDVSTEFDFICPCPISQSFNINVGGINTVTCFDFDETVCDDNVTCLTDVITLDCRF